jgi:predicted ATP-grasp superfamily ATP-dependent carboligase/peptidoglycan/xylan/chitin deacetylase (PgdA/CDA1 family)
LYFLAQRLGIPTAEASFPASRADVEAWLRDAAFPVMLKGIDGTRLQARTGKKMVIVHDAAELLSWYDRLEEPAAPNLMLQEYIPGGDDTIWMFNGYFNAASECLVAFTGQKLRQHPVHTGATSLGIQLGNDTVARLTIDFMRAVSYRGILDIGYRFDARDGRYKLLDPNPRIGQTFRLFVAHDGLDVARALYLDLTDQPVPAAPPCDGRKWVVEDKDVESALDYAREGTLTLRAWVRSFRGVEEGAWFATDDLRPFALAAAAFAAKAARYAARALAAAVRGARARAAATLGRRVKAVLGAVAYGLRLHRFVLGDRAVIACFHRVDDRFVGDFLTVSTAAFRRYCGFFARHFTVVSLTELLDRLAAGRPVAGCAVITFDDGYRDNAGVVADELARRGLPACFFVATDLIGSTVVPSWDAACGVRTEWMDWDAVRGLRARGFEVGAHTLTHADLGRVNGDVAAREIGGSGARLGRELGERVRLFSYPFGGRQHITAANRDLVRRAGYACCASAHGGLVTRGVDPYHLPRTAVSPWHLTPGQYGFELLLAALGRDPTPPSAA